MAYIGNVIAFLEVCILTDQKYGVFNYVDTPDSMDQLVSQVRKQLRGKDGVGLRQSYWLGPILGYTADLLKYYWENLPVSSIRVKKFASSTEFKSANRPIICAPYSLIDGCREQFIVNLFQLSQIENIFHGVNK